MADYEIRDRMGDAIDTIGKLHVEIARLRMEVSSIGLLVKISVALSAIMYFLFAFLVVMLMGGA